MSYFKQLDLPEYSNLLTELNKIVEWDKFGQICLNAPASDPDNHQAGQGSLLYDWDNSKQVWNESQGTYDLVIPERTVPLRDEDFTETTSCFRGTLFEDVLDALRDQHSVGRVRIMKLKHKQCLTWHKDDTARVHYPFKTNEGCKMIIEDEVKHLPQNTWWLTDTTRGHTAINASTQPRLHIVAVVL